jgi:large subunit ribosomal protein L17
LQDKEAVKELFGPVAEKVADRPGGYVRVIRTGFRRSDGAEMAMIEMVDFNEVYSTKEGKKSGGSGRRRTRRGGSSLATQQPANKTVAAEEEE